MSFQYWIIESTYWYKESIIYTFFPNIGPATKEGPTTKEAPTTKEGPTTKQHKNISQELKT